MRRLMRERQTTSAVLLALVTAAACSSDASIDDAGGAQGKLDSSVADADVASDADATSSAPVIEETTIAVGDFVFNARVAGPMGGDLVLLLHGFPETSYEWKSQLLALAEAGYRAVAPDQRGYSPGARPTDVDSYNIIALIGDAVGIADALDYERFHLVGHDWGGAVAWGLAGIYPDRVQTLTALSTPHPAAFSSALADTESCQYMASAYFEDLGKPDSSLADVAGIGIGFDGVPEDAVQEYMDEVLSKPEVLDAALNWYRANVADRQLAGGVGAISVPTLYLWGTADAAFCREPAEDSANYVDAYYRFVPIEGAGHWLPEAESETVNAELLAHVRK